MEARLNKNSLMWGAFFQDMEFNILSMTPGGWDKLLLECLLKAWKKKKNQQQPTMAILNEVEMPGDGK